MSPYVALINLLQACPLLAREGLVRGALQPGMEDRQVEYGSMASFAASSKLVRYARLI